MCVPMMEKSHAQGMWVSITGRMKKYGRYEKARLPVIKIRAEFPPFRREINNVAVQPGGGRIK